MPQSFAERFAPQEVAENQALEKAKALYEKLGDGDNTAATLKELFQSLIEAKKLLPALAENGETPENVQERIVKKTQVGYRAEAQIEIQKNEKNKRLKDTEKNQLNLDAFNTGERLKEGARAQVSSELAVLLNQPEHAPTASAFPNRWI